jgi:hypothetical protein
MDMWTLGAVCRWHDGCPAFAVGSGIGEGIIEQTDKKLGILLTGNLIQ